MNQLQNIYFTGFFESPERVRDCRLHPLLVDLLGKVRQDRGKSQTDLQAKSLVRKRGHESGRTSQPGLSLRSPLLGRKVSPQRFEGEAIKVDQGSFLVTLVQPRHSGDYAFTLSNHKFFLPFTFTSAFCHLPFFRAAVQRKTKKISSNFNFAYKLN